VKYISSENVSRRNFVNKNFNITNWY